MITEKIRRIIISRTDAIGDVVLTLPIASLLKKILGDEVKVIFWGRKYTKPVIDCCESVDEFLDYDAYRNLTISDKINFLKQTRADAIINVFPRKEIAAIARRAGIPLRIGTTNRLYHWYSCNKLIRLSRKNSTLHEAQLNAKLLNVFQQDSTLSLKEFPSLYRLTRVPILPEEIAAQLTPHKFNIVIHPKSNASAREWSMENYSRLIHSLYGKKFQIILTGGENEKNVLDEWAKTLPIGVLNFAGKLSLGELIAVLNKCDGIVAASTGPLHIAAGLGKHALGIYPPIRPMDPQRWAPLGIKSEFLVKSKSCSACRVEPTSCTCINEISVEEVEKRVLQWKK